jgi:hypothetical protein
MPADHVFLIVTCWKSWSDSKERSIATGVELNKETAEKKAGEWNALFQGAPDVQTASVHVYKRSSNIKANITPGSVPIYSIRSK